MKKIMMKIMILVIWLTILNARRPSERSYTPNSTIHFGDVSHFESHKMLGVVPFVNGYNWL